MAAKNTTPLLIGGMALLGIGALLLLAGGGGTVVVQDASDLEDLEGDRFVILVFDPEVDGALRDAFVGLSVPDATLVAVPMGVVQQWEGLDDAQVEQTTAIVALDMRRPPGAQTKVFSIPRDDMLASAVDGAAGFLRELDAVNVSIGKAIG